MRHLPAIDGLRAIAVLAVVAYHAGLGGAGFVGVDVFFVISGYLITRLLADELRDTGRIDFMHFYARRARRILPAAVLVVAVTLALSWLLLPTGKQAVAESAAAAGVFVANLFFQSATGDYWSDSAEMMPLLHLWSLSVEEQFYLLWPVLLIAVRRNPGPWLWGVAIASFALAEALLWFNPTAAFYQMPARAWELAAGGLVAVGALRTPPRAALPGLLLTLAACAIPAPHFPGVGALPAVAGSLRVIGAVHSGARLSVLKWRPVTYVGLISYSLYLWHWPLLALDRALRVGEAPLSTRLTLCAVAFVLAALSYRYVEQPFRRAQVRHGRAVVAGAACAAALSVTALAMANTVQKPIALPVPEAMKCHPWGPGATARVQGPHCVKDAPKLVLLGDSYGDSWEPLALAIAEREGLAVVSFAEPHCPPVLGISVERDSPNETAFCRRQSDKAVAYINANGADVVLVAARWIEHFQPRTRADAEQGLLALVRGLRTKRVMVIGPTPEVRDTAERCRALGADCAIPGAEFEAMAEPSREVMAKVAEHAEVIDAAGWLCEGGVCPAVRDGAPLYMDNRHVTADVARSFAADYLNRPRQ